MCKIISQAKKTRSDEGLDESSRAGLSGKFGGGVETTQHLQKGLEGCSSREVGGEFVQ